MKKSKYVMAGVVAVLLLFDVYSGFRWPGTWAMTSHVMNYKFGFMPRSLVGTAGHLVFGDYWYTSSLLLFSAMLFISVLLIGYFFYLIYRLILKEEKWLAGLVLFFMAFAGYPAFLMHESGYFEQYGYVFCLILTELALKKGYYVTLAASAVFAFLSVVISETNAFMVCPVLGMIVLAKYLEEEPGIQIKKLSVTAAAYIPALIYSYIAGTFRMPLEKCEEVIQYYVSKGLDFEFRTSAVYLLNNRTPEAEFQYGVFKAFPTEAFLYPALLILLTAVYLYYTADKKTVVSYVLFSSAGAFCSYFLCTMAWDFQRDMFGMMMAVFLFSIYYLRRYRKPELPEKLQIGLIVFSIVAMIVLGRFQIPVLDEGCYYRTLRQLGNDILLRLG